MRRNLACLTFTFGAVDTERIPKDRHLPFAPRGKMVPVFVVRSQLESILMIHPKLRLTVPWEAIELDAQNQILRVLALPELEKLAIMPDVHPGYDLCIGGVALLRGAIAPSFVGYDIGCGMCHVNLELTAKELCLERPKDREKFFARLQAAVPAGLGKKGNTPSDIVFQSACGDRKLDGAIKLIIRDQLATLGSGNHFLEIGENSKGHIGITIHSGSRRAGYNIAEWYIRSASGRFLTLNSELGLAYLADMLWGTDFALENRRLMLRAALSLFGFDDGEIRALLDNMINENHNHAVLQDDGVILHRKGATPAAKGQMGIIPANQRDGVWITHGLGNEEFLCSASHGAGRKMTRRSALRKGTVADMQKLMKGIVCRKDKDVLDEAPWAYKQIDDVLAAQEGILVDIVDHFRPIIVHKGSS
jgi:tRNA-splicing ligase RtcB